MEQSLAPQVNGAFGAGTAAVGGMLDVAKSRAAQEIQAAMVVAKKMPRDTNAAFNRIMNDCKRKSLAEKAVYAYPRGNQTVTGPSIRLAETIAKNWGNIDAGTVELETTYGVGKEFGESTMMAYAWDLETNTRITKVFTVRHKRDTKKGSYALEDDRDIYELTANQGARRLRACILAVIPGDIVEAAVEACTKTMEGGEGPIVDRIRKMVQAFSDDFQVGPDLLEKYLKHKLEATTEAELVRMHQVYRALRDGHANREDYFEISSTQTAQAAGLNATVAQAAPPPPPAQPVAPTAAQAPAAAPAAPAKKSGGKGKPAAAATPAAAAPAQTTATAPVQAPAKAEGSPVPSAPQGAPAQAAPAREPGEDDDVPMDFASAPSSITTPMPEERPQPPKPAPAPAAAPAVYRFDFGSKAGKSIADLGPGGGQAYLTQMRKWLSDPANAHMQSDPKIVRAIDELEKHVAATQHQGI